MTAASCASSGSSGCFALNLRHASRYMRRSCSRIVRRRWPWNCLAFFDLSRPATEGFFSSPRADLRRCVASTRRSLWRLASRPRAYLSPLSVARCSCLRAPPAHPTCGKSFGGVFSSYSHKSAMMHFGHAGRRATHIAPLKQQPVMRVVLVLVRRDFVELVFDDARVLARCDAGAIRHAEDVRIHRDGRVSEHDVQDHVRGLAPHAGQRFERFAIVRHFAAVQVQDAPAQLDQVLRLRVVEPDGFQIRLHAFFAEREDRGRRIRDRVELSRRGVDALVSGVRREHYGDEQLEGRRILELRDGLGIRFLQAAVDRADAGWGHVRRGVFGEGWGGVAGAAGAASWRDSRGLLAFGEQARAGLRTAREARVACVVRAIRGGSGLGVGVGQRRARNHHDAIHRGTARHTARSPCTVPRRRCASAGASQRSHRRDRAAGTSHIRCSGIRRSVRRALALPHRSRGSAAARSRSSNVASARIVAEPPGGHWLICASPVAMASA